MTPPLHSAEYNRFYRPPDGFTLIELLVVVAIIAVLISVLLPALQSARQQSYAARCASNLRQLGTGIYYYASDNGGLMPSVCRNATWFWSADIAPYVVIPGEGSDVYWQNVYTMKQKIWTCPMLHGKGGLSYIMPDMLGYNSQWYFDWPSVESYSDPARTVALLDGFVTWPNKAVHWWWPSSAEPRPAPAHQGASNVLLRDGHVERFSGSMIGPFKVRSMQAYKQYWYIGQWTP